MEQGRKEMRKFLALTTCATLLCGAAPTTSLALDLVLSHGYPPTHHLSVTYERFKDYVEKTAIST